MENYDLIIVGAGAAGLAAGIYGSRSGLKTLIIDEKLAGGTTGDAPLVENYPGFTSISGGELAEKMVQHCKKTGAVFREIEPVVSFNFSGEKKIVKTTREEYSASALIIATGAHYRELNVKGESEFKGKGVSYCGVCDGPFFKGKRVLVVGGGNSACISTLYLSGLAAEVLVVHRKETFRAEEALVNDISSKSNVKLMFSNELSEIKGDKVVKSAVLSNSATGQTMEVPVDGVFVQIGESPNSMKALEAGIIPAEDGCAIKIDIRQKTNISGVFAAGDVTDHPVMQIGTAVGQGITAALEAYSYIRHPYYRK
jgi:thioredoxin reductase (NADPH)